MTCKIAGCTVVITRAYGPDQVQYDKGLRARFSMNLVGPNGKTEMVLNGFRLFQGRDNKYRAVGPYKIIEDSTAPDDVPDDEAVKPLYFVSFFPTDPAEKQNLFNSLAELVLKKLDEFAITHPKLDGEKDGSRSNFRQIEKTNRIPR